MRGLDFTSWQSLLSTLVALALVTLIGVGLRTLAMSAIQQRRERVNRQINERLRLLIAAYKTLGGSFTGDLTVDPTHLRGLRLKAEQAGQPGEPGVAAAEETPASSDRARRMRDAVEAALSDIILLGTEEQVRLAAQAAGNLAAGQHVQTHELVISLRDFIRQALDLEPVPPGLEIPRQGPARPGAGGAGDRGKNKGGAEGERGGGGSGTRAGGSGAGAMGMGAGLGSMAGLGLDSGAVADQPGLNEPTERGG